MPSYSTTWTLLDAARSVEASSSLLDRLVAPMALLVALRWADTVDAEQAAIAEFNGEEPSCILPPALRWASWREAPRPLEAGEVTALWNGIRDVLGLPPDARGIHHELTLPEGKLLGEMVAWVDALALDTPPARRAAGETFTDLVLRSIDQTRFGGELMTPSTAGRLMVAFADPRPGERIYDPCFGTGGLLVEAADALWTRGREVSAGEWARAQLVPMFGVELHSELHLVALVRLLLAGVRPALELGDALEREAAGRHQDQGFDCVLADPPWGEKVEGAHLYDFPIGGRTSENLFFQHAVRSLRPGGRAMLAVPPSLLWREGPDRELREWLLGEYRVEVVLNFQARAFRGLRSVSPALVLVRRAPPVEAVAFVDLVALPDTMAECRNLVRAVVRGDVEAVAPHAFRRVLVGDLLKATARLVVPSDVEVAADSDLADLARLVDLVPLSEVASVAAGLSIPRSAVIDAPREGAIPVVRISEIGEGGLRLGERYLHPGYVAKAREDQAIRPGVVLLSVDGTIGKVHYVHSVPNSARDASRAGNGDPLAFAQKGLAVLRANETLDPRFLAAVLTSDTYQSLLRRLARGATIAHLSLRDLLRIRVPVPPPAVQQQVLRRLGGQPGDALEVLTLVLSGDDDDPLTGLLRDHPAFTRLLAEGMPEDVELRSTSLEVLHALRELRNRVAHSATTVVPTQAHGWLMVLGSIPLASLRDLGNGFRFEALTATQALVRSAVAALRSSDLMIRQLRRLTERLLAWVDGECDRAAGDFRISLSHDGSTYERQHDGSARALVRLSLDGTAHLGEFAIRGEDVGGDMSLAKLVPGHSVDIECILPSNIEWSGHEYGCWFTAHFSWSATRMDGAHAAGRLECSLSYLWSDWGPTGPFESQDREASETREFGSPELQPYGVSPYVTGDVVDDPSMFFGRQGVLDDIQAHLGGGTKVILLEGNRRTGKTSILRQLQRPEQGLLDEWLPVEASFQGTAGDRNADGISTEGIFRMLVRDIARATAKARIPVALPDVEDAASIATSPRRFALALTAYFEGLDPYEGLLIYVDAVTEAIAPRRLLLMLDEFDKLQVGIDNKVTSPQVPENIRNLLQTRRSVAAIITGSRRLKRLREEYWSALFGFGHRIGIDPLDPSEVADLARKPVVGRLVFTKSAVDAIAAQTSCQPYLVQSLCARIFELAKRQEWRRIGDTEIELAAERMVRDNEHFQALWSYAESERRRFLLWLCHALADEPHRVNAALLTQRLDRAGVLVPAEVVDDDLKFLRELELVALCETPVGPQYELAIPLMRRWMASNVDPEAQRRRAVNEHARLGGGYGSALTDGSGFGTGHEYGDARQDGDGIGPVVDGIAEGGLRDGNEASRRAPTRKEIGDG